jgi:hypothetical protein
MSSQLLLHDQQPQIGQLVGLAEGDPLQSDPPVALVAEEPDTVAEEHRREVHDDLIEQSGPEALATEARPEDFDILASGGSLRGCHRPLYSI